MLQIVSQLALTCKDQSITENWYVENFGFKRARVAKLPDGNETVSYTHLTLPTKA